MTQFVRITNSTNEWNVSMPTLARKSIAGATYTLVHYFCHACISLTRWLFTLFILLICCIAKQFAQCKLFILRQRTCEFWSFRLLAISGGDRGETICKSLRWTKMSSKCCPKSLPWMSEMLVVHQIFITVGHNSIEQWLHFKIIYSP